MSPFIETIRIENGRIYNLPYHNRRMNETRRDVLHQTGTLDLSDYIRPGNYRERTKCRVEYGTEILKTDYAAYQPYGWLPATKPSIAIKVRTGACWTVCSHLAERQTMCWSSGKDG